MSNIREVQVFCTLKIEGIHQWTDCPIDEVSYLRDPHRHLFGIKACKPVTHDDRDIEFIQLKHQLQVYLRSQYWDESLQLHVFGAMSCEMIANTLIDEFDLSRCDVDEDGENGAIVTVTQNPYNILQRLWR